MRRLFALLPLVLLAACLPLSPGRAIQVTGLAQTSAAILTQTRAAITATPAPSSTPRPSDPPPPTYTAPPPSATATVEVAGDLPATSVIATTAPDAAATPTPVNPVDCTNDSDFVRDVSVPDGSAFAPGIGFSKTWRLKNSGTCTWTLDYTIVFNSGDPLGPRRSFPLVVPVAPGQESDITINLLTPDLPGVYTSQWQLADPSGERFGTQPFTQIRVVLPTQAP